MHIKDLPKAELHLHLDCSLSYNVVKKINPAITENEYRHSFIAPEKCTDLVDFLTRAPMGYKLMQTKEHLVWVVEDLFEQLAEDNVIYAEIRFAPLLHIEKGLTTAEVVRTTEQAVAACVKKSGIEARLILCTLRHHTEEQSMETVKLVHQFAGTHVAAFDIAGDEAGYPVHAHIAAFNYAHEHGLHVTAHAGEARGADSVWETLHHFKPSRIGHGVRSIEDARLVQHLKDHHIHLELCPTCNVQINIYDTYKDHPADALYRQGVSVNINTDCRTITNISLRREYEKLQSVFKWTAGDFYACNVNAIKAAFIPETVKQLLLKKMEAGYKPTFPV